MDVKEPCGIAWDRMGQSFRLTLLIQFYWTLWDLTASNGVNIWVILPYGSCRIQRGFVGSYGILYANCLGYSNSWNLIGPAGILQAGYLGYFILWDLQNFVGSLGSLGSYGLIIYCNHSGVTLLNHVGSRR